MPDLAQQLADAAAKPLVEWMGFLHPAQARLVRRRFSGPARVRGPAGTGKSVVMLHRAAWLAETRPGRVLVTSYVRTLPHHQRAVYERISPHTVDRVDFLGVHEVAERLLADAGNNVYRHQGRIDAAFDAAWEQVGRCSGLAELESKWYWRQEIDSVIKGRGLAHEADYEALTRLGRAVWRGVEVFRPDGMSLPPAFGRDGFEMRADGTFIQQDIGPADGIVQVPGRWTSLGPARVAAFFDGTRPDYSFEVLEVDDSVLRRRRDPQPPHADRYRSASGMDEA